MRDIYKNTGTIHHAYAFQGEKMTVVPELFKFLEKDFGVAIKNNPDFSYQEFETFTIDDGRDLQERHNRRALAGKKIFIISTRFITSEAQNALLKIFEEPSEGAHFFLVMPNTQVLIPTLRSRLVVVDMSGEEVLHGGDVSKNEKSGLEIKSLVKKFLTASVAERLTLVKSIIEEKDKGKAIDFVAALEEALAPALHSQGKGELAENAGALTEILMVKKYLHDRAPSIKLLLEHLCLSVTINR